MTKKGKIKPKFKSEMFKTWKSLLNNPSNRLLESLWETYKKNADVCIDDLAPEFNEWGEVGI